jgi:hypothetical protein
MRAFPDLKLYAQHGMWRALELKAEALRLGRDLLPRNQVRAAPQQAGLAVILQSGVLAVDADDDRVVGLSTPVQY